MKILVYIDHVNGAVADASLELIALAQSLNSSVEALVCASNDNIAEKITQQLSGVDNVCIASGSDYENYMPNKHQQCLNQVIAKKEPDLVLLSYSTSGVDLGAAAAYKNNLSLVGYITDMSIDDAHMVTTSQVYGGKLLANVKTLLPAIGVVMPGAIKSQVSQIQAPTVENVSIDDSTTDNVKVLDTLEPESGGIDLTKADRIVCIGRALGGVEKLSIVEELASKLDAEVAGSRPVIDAGWLPKARQVGKSGTKVKPKLYLMAGVSGAAEHLEGMGDSELIIAINSDEQAPIFSKAHYGAVCDMFHVLPALVTRLQDGG